jgi:hypothetical protein
VQFQRAVTFSRPSGWLAEPPDRESLRAVLEQRCTDWRERLRSEHPEEARFVVQQLIGPLTLWNGRGGETFAPMEGFDPDDRRGHEGISFEDYGFQAVVTPLGLLNGLGAFNMVAGVRSRQYRLTSEYPLNFTWWPRDQHRPTPRPDARSFA